MARSLTFVFAEAAEGLPLVAFAGRLSPSLMRRGLQFVFYCGRVPCRVVCLERAFACMSWMPLRRTAESFPHKLYSLTAKVWHLYLFKRSHMFCGRCGARLRFTPHQTVYCPRCGHEQWPHFAPAVIALITRRQGREALLLSSRSFRRADSYGLLAGYLEPGETFEECLRREVMEETSLTITNIRYVASQSWPMKGAVMVAFTAEYQSGSLHLQESELRDGGWYTRDGLPPHIPPRDSIARRLIDHWLSEGE